MISYAQNYEDVLIQRCFQGQTGVYVDVGSHHPVLDSTTCHFYQNGWHGLNIDALDTHHALFQRLRARDTNIVSAVGATSGALPFYTIPGTGLSTLDPLIAERHAADGFKVLTQEAPMATLSELLERHGVDAIDFLKIDVEGVEGDVISGMDWERWRPKLLVIEATPPMSPQRNSEIWSGPLRENSYACVFFDGLNEYWVADEAGDLRAHFDAPANVFDEAVRAREYALQRSFDDVGLQRWLKRLLPVFQAGTSPQLEHLSHLKAVERLPSTQDDAVMARRLTRTVLGARDCISPEAINHAMTFSDQIDAVIEELMASETYLDLVALGHALVTYNPEKVPPGATPS